MSATTHILDLNFLGFPRAIAAYLIPHSGGNSIALVESGPGSTLKNLQAGVQSYGYELQDISDVLLTHIHLDHAGASGALARYGARIHVHPNGAPHLVNPEKLLSSAQRIYGDNMDRLWGEFLAVPEEQISIPVDGEAIHIGEHDFIPLDTPGHANHHYAYLLGDLCFSGDIGGVRMPGVQHLRIPMPPPEIHLESWRASIAKIRQARPKAMAPTHFGIFYNANWHLQAVEIELDRIESWLEGVMRSDPDVDEINRQFQAWVQERSQADGVAVELQNAYETANPSWMSAAGMQRYWKKYRQQAGS